MTISKFIFCVRHTPEDYKLRQNILNMKTVCQKIFNKNTKFHSQFLGLESSPEDGFALWEWCLREH